MAKRATPRTRQGRAKPRGGGSPECKAQASQTGPRPAISAALADAARTGDLVAALDRAGLTLPELHRAAADVPEIAGQLLEVQAVIRSRAIAAVEAKAAAGDLKAIRALADGTLEKWRGELDEDTRRARVETDPRMREFQKRGGGIWDLIALGLTIAEGWTPPPPPAVLTIECCYCHKWQKVTVANGQSQGQGMGATR